MEIDGCVFDAVVRKLVLDSLDDVSLDVELVVVGQAIDFVDEDFDVDVWVAGLKVEDCAVEAVDGFEVVVLSIDDPEQGTNFAEDSFKVEGGAHEIDLAREVPDLEVHERAKVVRQLQQNRTCMTHCIESF